MRQQGGVAGPLALTHRVARVGVGQHQMYRMARFLLLGGFQLTAQYGLHQPVHLQGPVPLVHFGQAEPADLADRTVESDPIIDDRSQLIRHLSRTHPGQDRPRDWFRPEERAQPQQRQAKTRVEAGIVRRSAKVELSRTP